MSDDQAAATAESAPAAETEKIEAPAEESAAPAAAEEAPEAPAVTEETQAAEPKESAPKDLGAKGVHELKRTRQRAQQAELEAARLRGRIEALEQYGLKPVTEQKTYAVDDGLTPPNPDDFSSHSEYVAAVSNHAAKRAIHDYEQAQVRKAQAAEQRKAAEQAAQVRGKMIEAGMREFGEDFEDSVINNQDVTITPVMATAIYESDAGHILAKHLADNPQESERIAALSPARQIRELVAIEAKITAARQPKTTAAPAPIRPIKGGAPAHVDESKLSDEDYFRLEKQRMAEKRRGRV